METPEERSELSDKRLALCLDAQVARWELGDLWNLEALAQHGPSEVFTPRGRRALLAAIERRRESERPDAFGARRYG